MVDRPVFERLATATMDQNHGWVFSFGSRSHVPCEHPGRFAAKILTPVQHRTHDQAVLAGLGAPGRCDLRLLQGSQVPKRGGNIYLAGADQHGQPCQKDHVAYPLEKLGNGSAVVDNGYRSAGAVDVFGIQRNAEVTVDGGRQVGGMDRSGGDLASIGFG